MSQDIHSQIEMEKEFTASYRWQHWLRMVAIVTLTITGFYIAVPYMAPGYNPTPTGFMQALMRGWHIIAGFVLIAVFLYKSYLFFFARTHKNETESVKDLSNPKVWMQQIGYYLLVSKHPKLSGVYNPLQFMAYVSFYLMLVGLIVTGLVLYVHVFHNGLGALLYTPMRFFEVLLGGITNVRLIHHLLMWGVILFVVGHVYMAIYNAVFGKEGGMDAIFSGIKWKKEH